MILYNSLTRRREPLATHEPGVVRMYTCGPTVYHFAHIGNLRTYVMEDLLERALRYEGYRVDRVMNITDVGHLTSDADEGEDKMLKGARREHKSVLEIARFYTDAFFADCEDLHIARPAVVEPATACIPDFIRVIEALLERGYAYEAGGNIYFDTSRLPRYYVFGEHREENLAVGVREGVEEDGNKRNKADFVLWFTKSKFDSQELKWSSPFGEGYPGWHIECSCIAMKHLGEYLDLHCGGVDNIFPHHTNEIAQSEAYLGHPWCPHWFHVEHLRTEGGKMSKSSGEFLTLPLLKEKGYDPLAYRYFCLASHYRKPLLFTYENLDGAASAYRRLLERVAAIYKENEGISPAASPERLAALTRPVHDALDSDLNSSLALTAVLDILKGDALPAERLAAVADADRVLALDLLPRAKALSEARDDPAEQTPPDIAEAIAARAAAKREKNFAEADRIRAQLAERGIQLIDTPNGTVWKKA